MIVLAIGALALVALALASRGQAPSEPAAPPPALPPAPAPYVPAAYVAPPAPRPRPTRRPARPAARPQPTPAPVAPVAPVTPQAAPVVPDLVSAVLSNPDAREGDIAQALEVARAANLPPQVALLEGRLARVRQIIAVLEEAQATSNRGDAVSARNLLIRARSLSVADGRTAIIATIDRQMAALPDAAQPVPAPLPSPAVEQATAEVRAIQAELVRAQGAADVPALAALVPRMLAVVPVLRSQGRAELADEIQRNADLVRSIVATAQAPGEAAPAAPAPAPGAPAEGIEALALRVARNIARSPHRGYDRALLRQFQAQAGIGVDGKFGSGTREALALAGVPAAQLPPRTLYW